MEHTGDNLTGAGAGDDEALKRVLDKGPPAIQHLVVAVTIHEVTSGACSRLVNLDSDAKVPDSTCLKTIPQKPR